MGCACAREKIPGGDMINGEVDPTVTLCFNPKKLGGQFSTKQDRLIVARRLGEEKRCPAYFGDSGGQVNPKFGKVPVLAIIFEVENTLWNKLEVEAIAANKMHRWLQSHYPRFASEYSADAILDKVDDMRREFRENKVNDVYGMAFKKALYLLAEDFGINDMELSKEAFHVFEEARRRDAKMRKGVLELLAWIRNQGILVGVISTENVDVYHDELPPKLAESVDFCVTADTIGASILDSRDRFLAQSLHCISSLFSLVEKTKDAENAGVSWQNIRPESIMVFGTSPRLVKGAHRQNMNPVLFAPQGKKKLSKKKLQQINPKIIVEKFEEFYRMGWAGLVKNED